MTEAAGIAAKLTEAQRQALTHAAFLLDAMAGEGVGVEVEMVDGSFAEVFADDAISDLCLAFGINITVDGPAAFALSVRSVLQEKRP